VATGREPGDVTGVAQDDRGAQRADPVDVGDGGARRQDGFGDALARALFEPRRSENPASGHFAQKPNRNGGQGSLETARRAPRS
jgi:hypothetical protein